MESIITDFKGHMVIKSIPEKTVKAYVKDVGASSFERLTLKQKEQVFLLAVEDFYIGNLDLDELSALGGSLWNSLGADRSSEFANALYAANELSYYIRVISHKQDRSSSTLESFLLDIKVFFSKHNPKRAEEIFLSG